VKNFQTLGDLLLREFIAEMQRMPYPWGIWVNVFESGKWKIQEAEAKGGIIAHDCDPQKWSVVQSGKVSCPSCYEFVPHEVINTYRILYMRNP
jgi:hypothetical protein